MLEGKSTDKQAHRESDTAKACSAIQMQPAQPGRSFRQSQHDHQPHQAKDADLLAEKQACRNSERDRVVECFEFHALERYASIGEGKYGQDAESDPGVENVLEVFSRRCVLVRFDSQRHSQSGQDACKRRVNARFDHENPHQNAEQDVGRDAGHTTTVDEHHDGEYHQGQHQRCRGQVLRIKNGNDADGRDVVDDGDCGDQDFECQRRP